MNKYFNLEIYVCNEVTGETGWDILFISVRANSIEEAVKNIKDYPNFDVIILFNFSHEENEDSIFLRTENYPEFKILERWK